MRDENIPLASTALPKSLHQRNKSTPALLSLQPQGLNVNPPKRAAFADVSNIFKAPAPAKDDLLLKEKINMENISAKSTKNISQEQPFPKLQSVKSAALLRPAQRPLSAAIPKSTLPTFNEPYAPLASKRISETGSDTSMSKPAVKRQTTVFSELDVALTKAPAETRPTVTVAPVHQSLTVPIEKPPPVSADALKESVTLDKATGGVPIAPQGSQVSALPVPPAPQAPMKGLAPPIYAAPVDGILPPVYSDLQLEASIFDQVNAFQTKSDDLEEFLPALESQINEFDPLKDVKDVIKAIKVPTPTVHEIEEYWDDEEDEEYYDAEGYTTARSFRSKGDNTTGGMTIVLAPRVTARVERELAAARVYVESTQTEEDLDDETWDTSMVIEYGEEIFEYMKELEVSGVLLCNFDQHADIFIGTYAPESLLHGKPG